MTSGYRARSAPAMALTRSIRTSGPAAAAALLLAAVLGSAPAMAAERASKSESVGVATGLAVGAAAGGPVGAVLGAAAGAWLGDRHHRQRESIETLEETVADGKVEATRLSSEVESLATTVAALERSATQVQATVHFRTGETGVREVDAARLRQLAAWVRDYDVRVRVIGYADPRGSAELNWDLSQERAESVARVLQAAGLDPSVVTIEARGAEPLAVEQMTVDNFALERRVQIEIEPRETAVARHQR
jgi:outer membrane protein OmpA-like peptidoglycan-associated protein